MDGTGIHVDEYKLCLAKFTCSRALTLSCKIYMHVFNKFSVASSI